MMESVRWAYNFRIWSPKFEEIKHAFSLIQSEEKDRIAQFMFKKDAKASLCGRLLMRHFISSKLDLPWSTFKLGRTEKGRPYLMTTDNFIREKFSFNVSHQGNFVVLAAEGIGTILGVDIVKIETPSTKNVAEFFRLMTRQFTSAEWNVIKSSGSEEDQLKAFYRNWALKEALVKSLGVGIAYGLKSLSFEIYSSLSPCSVLKDTKVKINGLYDNDWIFEESLLDGDHIVTVAHHFSKDCRVADVDYPKFEILNFDDIVMDARRFIPEDVSLADEFIKKKEGPWEY